MNSLSRLAVLLLCLWPIGLWAGPAPCPKLPSNDEQLGLTACMQYLPDHQAQLSLHTAMQSASWRPLPGSNLGYLSYPVWTWAVLENHQAQDRQLILYITKPGTNRLDVHLIDQNGQITTHALGLLNAREGHPLWHRNIALPLTIPAGEQLTVISRIETVGPVEAGWTLAGLSAFSTQSSIENFLWGLFAGAVISLVIYNLMLWFSLKQPFLLAYVALGSGLLVSALTTQGLYRLFDLGLPLIWHFYGSWLSASVMTAAMLLFGMLFLQTRQTMPRLHRWLILLLVANGLALLAGMLGTWNNEIFLHSAWMHLVFMISYGSLVIVALTGILRRVTGAGYYLAGQGSLFVVAGFVMLNLQGRVEQPAMIAFLLPFGALIDISFLAKAISERVGEMKRELELQRERSIAQSRFATLGKSTSMIAHQWRTPLASQGALLTEMQILLNKEEPAAQLPRLRDTLLPRMQENLQLMVETVSDFRQLFAGNLRRQNFQPADVIDHCLLLLRPQEQPQGLSLEWQRPKTTILVWGSPQALTHILLILLENALDTFRERRTQSPRLTLTLSQGHRAVILEISDNAGGIQGMAPSRVFESLNRLSQRNDGMGMGLYIARMLCTDHLGGRIEAWNNEEGACFRLTLPPHGHIEKPS